MLGDCVYTYEVEEYRQMRLFLTPDGKAGIALKPNGDMVSVFTHREQKDSLGGKTVHTLIELAINEGAGKADCYGYFLVKLYGMHGFRAIAKDAFNAEFATEAMQNRETMLANFKDEDGKPDVVYLVYEGNRETGLDDFNAKYTPTYQDKLGYSDYDTCCAAQDAGVKVCRKIEALPAEVKQPVLDASADLDLRHFGLRELARVKSERNRRRAVDMVHAASTLQGNGVDVFTEAGQQEARDMAEYAARCREQLEARAKKPLDEETQARILATLARWEHWHELDDLKGEAARWDGKARVTPRLVEVPAEESGFSSAVTFSPSEAEGLKALLNVARNGQPARFRSDTLGEDIEIMLGSAGKFKNPDNPNSKIVGASGLMHLITMRMAHGESMEEAAYTACKAVMAAVNGRVIEQGENWRRLYLDEYNSIVYLKWYAERKAWLATGYMDNGEKTSADDKRQAVYLAESYAVTQFGCFEELGAALERAIARLAREYKSEMGQYPLANISHSVSVAREVGIMQDGKLEADNGTLYDMSGASFAIMARHASPHSGIRKFLMEFIGTGEGAQAYGHGLYFSTSEGVHRSYVRQFRNRYKELVRPADNIPSEVFYLARAVAHEVGAGHSKEQVMERFRQEARERYEREKETLEYWEKSLEERKQEEGYYRDEDMIAVAERKVDVQRMEVAHYKKQYDTTMQGTFDDFFVFNEGVNASEYEVMLNFDRNGENLLHWGEEVPEEQLKLLLNSDNERVRFQAELCLGCPPDMRQSGAQLYKSLVREFKYEEEDSLTPEQIRELQSDPDARRARHQKAASEALLAVGIKGIEYRDGSSRNDGADITYNYVIFDEADAKVVRVKDHETGYEWQDYTDATASFSIRSSPPPNKTGIGYKVFYRGKDGKLYPPMVANPGGQDTPVGVWLDADEGTRAPDSKTGRPQVKAGGKGTQGGSGSLSYRPGWHLGEIPYAVQFNRKDPVTGEKTLFPADFVWAEVEYAMDEDYQEEAMSYGYTENGKFRHSYAGLPRLPKDGFYRYRTNPNPATDPWIITGAMKVNRILSNEEVDAIVRAAGREPQRREGERFSVKTRTDGSRYVKVVRVKDSDTGRKWQDYTDTTATFSVIGPKAATFGNYRKNRSFRGLGDGIRRVEIDASQAVFRAELPRKSFADKDDLARFMKATRSSRRNSRTLYDVVMDIRAVRKKGSRFIKRYGDKSRAEVSARVLANYNKMVEDARALGQELGTFAPVLQERLFRDMYGISRTVHSCMDALMEALKYMDVDKVHDALIREAKGSFRMETVAWVGNSLKANELLHYPEFFAAYPHLETFPIWFRHAFQNPNVEGVAHPDHIEIKAGLTRQRIMEIALHELQHKVQEFEGFIEGGSDELYSCRMAYLDEAERIIRDDMMPQATARERRKLDKELVSLDFERSMISQMSPYDWYRHLGGEQEAFAVDARAGMSAQERKASPFNGEMSLPILDFNKTYAGLDVLTVLQSAHVQQGRPQRTESEGLQGHEPGGVYLSGSLRLPTGAAGTSVADVRAVAEAEGGVVERPLGDVRGAVLRGELRGEDGGLSEDEVPLRDLGSNFSAALKLLDSSTSGHGGLTAERMAFVQSIADNMRKVLDEEVARFRTFDTKVGDGMSREKALVAIGAVWNMVRSVAMLLPEGYRVNVRPWLNQLQVFAELAATGDLDLTEDMASQKVRDMEEVQGRMAGFKGGVDALVKEYGNEKVNEVLAKILTKVGDKLTKMERDAAVESLRSLLARLEPKRDPRTGKLARGIMGAEGYEEVARVAEALQLDAEGLDAKLTALEAAIAKAQSDGNEEEAMRLQGEHTLFSTFGNLRGMSLAQVVAAYEKLKELVHWNKWEWDEVLAERRFGQLRMIDETVRGLGGLPGLNAEHEARLEKPVRKRLRNVGDVLKSFTQVLSTLDKVGAGKLADSLRARLNAGMEGIKTSERERWARIEAVSRKTLGKSWRKCMNMLHEVQETGIPFDQPLFKTVRLARAYAEELVAMTPAQRKAEWEANEAMGGSMALARYSEAAVAAMQEELAKGGRSREISVRFIEEMRHEENLKLSKGQAMYVLLMYEQPTYTEQMQAQGYTEEFMDRLRKWMGKDVVAFAYGLRDIVAENTPRVKEVYERQFGVPFPAEHNYFPARWKVPQQNDELMMAIAGFGGAPGASTGFLKPRVQHGHPLDTSKDALQVMLQAMTLSDAWMHTQDLIADLNAYMRDRKFDAAMVTALGKDGYANFKAWVELLKNGGARQVVDMGAAQSWVDRLYGASAVATLGLRIQTLFRQLGAIMNGLNGAFDVSVGEYIGSLVRQLLGKAPMSYRRMARSELIMNRKTGHASTLQGQAMRPSGEKVGALEGALKMAMLPMERVDAFLTASGLVPVWNAYYRQARRKGASHEEAEQDAWVRTVECANRASQPIGWVNKSKMAQERSITSRAVLFMLSEDLNKMGLCMSLWQGGHKRRAMRAWLIYGACNAMVSAMLDYLCGDPDDWEEAHWWEYVLSAVYGPLASCPGIGEAVEGLGTLLLQGVGKVAGIEELEEAHTRASVGRAFIDVQGTAKACSKLYDMWTDDDEYSVSEHTKQVMRASRPASVVLSPFLGGVGYGLLFLQTLMNPADFGARVWDAHAAE